MIERVGKEVGCVSGKGMRAQRSEVKSWPMKLKKCKGSCLPAGVEGLLRY